jgi:hypothetical protein
MRGVRLLALGGAACTLAALAACGSGSAPTDITHLTAQQAALIRDRMGQIAVLQGELSWLSDSANLVIAAGAEVTQRAIMVDGVSTTYYAVGLHREVAQSSVSSFTTFHLLAFDNPNDPRKFIVANGYANASNATPPTSVSAAFGGQSVFAHVIEVTNIVTSWQAMGGTASFAVAGGGTPCSDVSLPAGTTCNHSSFEAQFSVTSTGPPTQPLTSATSRTATLALTAIPAVTLHIGPP